MKALKDVYIRDCDVDELRSLTSEACVLCIFTNRCILLNPMERYFAIQCSCMQFACSVLASSYVRSMRRFAWDISCVLSLKREIRCL